MEHSTSNTRQQHMGTQNGYLPWKQMNGMNGMYGMVWYGIVVVWYGTKTNEQDEWNNIECTDD